MHKHSMSAVAELPAPAAHLQDDGELLRGIAVLHTHGQPHLESSQLLRKEGTVLLRQEQECKFGLKQSQKQVKQTVLALMDSHSLSFPKPSF